jgi:DNA-binding NtrC family response regulator
VVEHFLAEAAQVLGSSRKNLWEKMKAYGME